MLRHVFIFSCLLLTSTAWAQSDTVPLPEPLQIHIEQQSDPMAQANVLRMSRRLDAAADAYLRAYEESGRTRYDALLAHAQIALELGDIARANSEAREVLSNTDDYSLKRRAYTLVARAIHESGDSETALEMLNTLASLAVDNDDAARVVEVESLLLMHEIEVLTGKEAEGSASLLLEVFPQSVAAGIVTGEPRAVTSPGLPSALLLSIAEPVAEETPEVSAVARREQPRLSAVQVGSFSDEENAANLVTDLRSLGLDARLETISREGTSLHQVSVNVPEGSTENAARIFAILSQHGFDGFLVY